MAVLWLVDECLSTIGGKLQGEVFVVRVNEEGLKGRANRWSLIKVR